MTNNRRLSKRSGGCRAAKARTRHQSGGAAIAGALVRRIDAIASRDADQIVNRIADLSKRAADEVGDAEPTRTDLKSFESALIATANSIAATQLADQQTAVDVCDVAQHAMENREKSAEMIFDEIARLGIDDLSVKDTADVVSRMEALYASKLAETVSVLQQLADRLETVGDSANAAAIYAKLAEMRAASDVAIQTGGNSGKYLRKMIDGVVHFVSPEGIILTKEQMMGMRNHPDREAMNKYFKFCMDNNFKNMHKHQGKAAYTAKYGKEAFDIISRILGETAGEAGAAGAAASDAARRAASDAAFKAAEEAARRAASDAAFKAAEEAARKASSRSASDAAFKAAEEAAARRAASRAASQAASEAARKAAEEAAREAASDAAGQAARKVGESMYNAASKAATAAASAAVSGAEKLNSMGWQNGFVSLQFMVGLDVFDKYLVEKEYIKHTPEGVAAYERYVYDDMLDDDFLRKLGDKYPNAKIAAFFKEKLDYFKSQIKMLVSPKVVADPPLQEKMAAAISKEIAAAAASTKSYLYTIFASDSTKRMSGLALEYLGFSVMMGACLNLIFFVDDNSDSRNPRYHITLRSTIALLIGGVLLGGGIWLRPKL